jgi:putative transposase
MRSSSGCAAAASGISSPSGSGPRVPSTTGSGDGPRGASWRRSGRSSSPSASSSAGRIGDGRAPTRCWARPGSGGKKTGKNPTDRGKKGTKKSLVTDADGGPLGVVIAGANVVEQKLLADTIEAIVVERPEPSADEPQNLCLDKGYDNPRSEEAATAAGYTPHVRRIGEEAKACDTSKGHKPRRWVVERTFAWLSKCRGLLVRYEKSDINYLGMIQLACALLWYRRLYRLTDRAPKGVVT